MRKLVLSIHVTMDGLMAGPSGELDWHYAYWNDEMAQASIQQLQQAGVLVTGRVTYEAMINYWGRMAVSPLTVDYNRQYARLLCKLPKIVFSNTLLAISRPETILVTGNLALSITALKRQPGKQLISWGGVNMAHALIEARLVDVYQLWVAPVTLKKGIPLFTNPAYKNELTLLNTQIFSNGVTLFYYHTQL